MKINTLIKNTICTGLMAACLLYGPQASAADTLKSCTATVTKVHTVTVREGTTPYTCDVVGCDANNKQILKCKNVTYNIKKEQKPKEKAEELCQKVCADVEAGSGDKCNTCTWSYTCNGKDMPCPPGTQPGNTQTGTVNCPK